MRIFFLRISLFRFLLEGYDGLAVLTTVDVQQGLVRLIVPKDRYDELWCGACWRRSARSWLQWMKKRRKATICSK